MAHPKSMYMVTADGLQEKHAMSLDEQHQMEKDGWFGHPEEARYAGVARIEQKKTDLTIDEMNQEELEIYARGFGVELDRRKSLTNMRRQLEELLQ